MPSYSTHIDYEYYKNKYNPLHCNDKKSILEHYNKIGKQKGYFPNSSSEDYFCKNQNFDSKYYVRKYNLPYKTKIEAREHWKNQGFKLNYFVNICEEQGEHNKILCKCKIKGIHNDYISDCFSTQTESECYDSCKDDVNLNHKSDSILEQISDDIPQSIDSELLLKNAERIINNNLEKYAEQLDKIDNQRDISYYEEDNSYDSDSSDDDYDENSNSITNNNISDEEWEKEKKLIKYIQLKKHVKIPDKIPDTIYETRELSSSEDADSTVISIKYHGTRFIIDSNHNTNESNNNDSSFTPLIQNHTSTNIDSSFDEESTLSTISVVTKQQNNSVDDNEVNDDIDDSFDSDFESEFFDDNYSVSNGNYSNKLLSTIQEESLGFENIERKIKEEKEKMFKKEEKYLVDELNNLEGRYISDKSDSTIFESIVEEKIKHNENEMTKIKNRLDSSLEDTQIKYQSSNKFIFDSHMDIVMANINDTIEHINFSIIHLKTFINTLKQVYKCFIDIANNKNNMIIYNTSFIKISKLLRELDNIVKNSNCNDHPLFRQRQNKKSTKYIIFPIFKCDNDRMDKYFEKNVGKNHIFIKIELMDLSLITLKLNKYILPQLKNDDIMSFETNPIPSDSCMIGRKPERWMYKEEELIKNWSIKHHLDLFQNAINKSINIEAEYNTINDLLITKKEMALKIKLTNLKDE
jgi:hypothetical protein